MDEPYPDMTDEDVLEKLLSMALSLLQSDRHHGEQLWEIFRYLEKRLESDPEKVSDAAGIPETIKDILDRHNGTVNIITGCQIESVTIKSS